MKRRVLSLGAGFAGLELATSLSETHGERVALTVIHKSDAFVSGYSLDVVFWKSTLQAVRLPYRTSGTIEVAARLAECWILPALLTQMSKLADPFERRPETPGRARHHTNV